MEKFQLTVHYPCTPIGIFKGKPVGLRPLGFVAQTVVEVEHPFSLTAGRGNTFLGQQYQVN